MINKKRENCILVNRKQQTGKRHTVAFRSATIFFLSSQKDCFLSFLTKGFLNNQFRVAVVAEAEAAMMVAVV